MLRGQPDESELRVAAAAHGMVYEPTPEPGVPLWREHVTVVELFTAMQTQWVTDAHGQPALNYCALPAVEQRLRIRPKVSAAIFPDLRVMEAEARKVFAGR